MTFKEFIRPTKTKIISTVSLSAFIFILILILYLFINMASGRTQSISPNSIYVRCCGNQPIYGINSSQCKSFSINIETDCDTLKKQITLMNKKSMQEHAKAASFVIPVVAIITYLLSCIISYIRNKFVNPPLA